MQITQLNKRQCTSSNKNSHIHFVRKRKSPIRDPISSKPNIVHVSLGDGKKENDIRHRVIVKRNGQHDIGSYKRQYPSDRSQSCSNRAHDNQSTSLYNASIRFRNILQRQKSNDSNSSTSSQARNHQYQKRQAKKRQIQNKNQDKN